MASLVIDFRHQAEQRNLMCEVQCLNHRSNLWNLAILVCYSKMTRGRLREIPGQPISYRRRSMFDVTQKATEKIKEAIKDQEKNSPIRVVYNEGG